MRKLTMLLAVLLLCACAPAPGNVTPARSAPAEIADYVTNFNSSHEWEHSQWYRVGDSFGTVGFFVVSEVGSICLVQDGRWVVAQHGKSFVCPGGWRSPSNSIGSTGSRVPR